MTSINFPRRTQKTLENGTVTTYGYDVASQLTTLVHRNAAAAKLAGFAYAYDKGGRRTAKTLTGAINRAESYSYDAIDQVTLAVYSPDAAEAFAYDAMGNRRSATRTTPQGAIFTAYTANALNQFTQVSSFGTAPAYDSNGNTLTLGAERTFAYDGQNRLTYAWQAGYSLVVHHRNLLAILPRYFALNCIVLS